MYDSLLVLIRTYSMLIINITIIYRIRQRFSFVSCICCNQVTAESLFIYRMNFCCCFAYLNIDSIIVDVDFLSLTVKLTFFRKNNYL